MQSFFSTERAKLKEMTFAEKRWYIWEYYKLHILFTVIGIAIVIGFINVWIINPPKREHLYIAWLAGSVHEDRLEELSQSLNVLVHEQDQHRYQVSVRSYVLSDNHQLNRAISTRFHALLAVGDIHAVIATSEGIQENADFGVIRPPVDLLALIRESNPPLYDIVSQRLLSVTFVLDEEDVTSTMAISLSDSRLLEGMGFTTDGLYMGVISNSLHINEIAQALAVIFGFEIED
ncbi:MAG: hypothetical protein FWC92_10035 [Defluviitaleaceae bacterium]|nr:hypothetical protein [Defluviitaleaceae bacterium]